MRFPKLTSHSRGVGRRSGRDADAAQVRVLDAPAGPPMQPMLVKPDVRLADEHEGIRDGERGLYDVDSFGDITPLHIRERIAHLDGHKATARRREIDDREVADVFVREQAVALRHAEETLGHRQRELDEARLVRAEHAARLRGADGERSGWRAPERLYEPRRHSLLLGIGIPVLGMALEAPWSFLALQELGDSTVATIAMAVVFGWVGVLLAHLAGGSARRARAGEGRGHAITAAVCAACLLPVGLMLADTRWAAVATPTTTGDPSAVQQFGLSSGIVFAAWLAVNAGMWVAVGILSYLHTNRYVAAHRDAMAAERAAGDAHVASVAAPRDAEIALEQAQSRRQNCAAKWAAYQNELTALAAECSAIYCRALAGVVKDPAFSTAIELASQPPATEERPQRTPLQLARPSQAADVEEPA